MTDSRVRVHSRDDRSDEELIHGLDALHVRACSVQRELLRLIAEVDRRELWRDWGARDTAHWLCMHYGISWWKAHRWIAAAHALEGLPLISHAFSAGELGIDKVVELTRFATPDTEAGLIRWAQGVSCGAIRHKADLARRSSIEEAQEAERSRSLSWWYFQENTRFGLQAELPAAQGAVVAKALERLAQSLPVMPGEEDPYYAEARRADALVGLCSARISEDATPDRATVVHWERGGRTDLDNLILVCTFHHKLVHEYGWRVSRDPDGTVRWLRPDGIRHRAGPAPPPPESVERQPALAAAAF